MQFSQFEEAWGVLISAYGDKMFPNIRKKLFYERFKHVNAGAFLEATKKIAFTMMQANQVGIYLEERFPLPQVKQEKVSEHFDCEPCRDWGFGWVGHNIVPCVCARGKSISTEEIATQQKNYDVGRRIFSGRASIADIAKRLPYDPNKRGA